MAALEPNSFLFNADDFGMGSHISDGITLAVNQGIVTSVSVCMNGRESAEDIRRRLRNVSTAQIGLHINLTEGFPVLLASRLGSLVNEEKRFRRAD